MCAWRTSSSRPTGGQAPIGAPGERGVRGRNGAGCGGTSGVVRAAGRPAPPPPPQGSARRRSRLVRDFGDRWSAVGGRLRQEAGGGAPRAAGVRQVVVGYEGLGA